MKVMRERDELMKHLTSEMQSSKSQELGRKAAADVKIDKRDIDKRILYLARVKSQYNEMQNMSGVSNTMPNSHQYREGTAQMPTLQMSKTVGSKRDK